MNPSLPPLSPLIKWSGGKRSELPVLRPAYPENITRVIEPFAGGSAVSLDLNPGQVVLGDVSPDLIDFYQALGRDDVREEMIQKILDIQKIRKAVADWVGALSDDQVAEIAQQAIEAKQSKKIKSKKSAGEKHKTPSPILSNKLVRGWVGHTQCGSEEQNEIMIQWFIHDIEASLLNKMARINKLGIRREQGGFTGNELRPHLLTALHAGVYTSLRRIYNQQQLVRGPVNIKPTKKDGVDGTSNIDGAGTRAWRVACWYVVRNLCYAGMFRFGPNGKFNVPYGGVSYNSRDFSRIRQTLLNKDVLAFFGSAEIHLLDFDSLMDKYENFGGTGSGDFIFVDPPYDSAFSQYNSEEDFTQDDQRRLANRLKQVSTPWMLVIKKTEFILSLYENEPGQAKLFRAVFDKSYQVNIRNRNNAEVEHLVVTNYPLPHSATVNGGGGLSPIP